MLRFTYFWTGFSCKQEFYPLLHSPSNGDVMLQLLQKSRFTAPSFLCSPINWPSSTESACQGYLSTNICKNSCCFESSQCRQMFSQNVFIVGLEITSSRYSSWKIHIISTRHAAYLRLTRHCNASRASLRFFSAGSHLRGAMGLFPKFLKQGIQFLAEKFTIACVITSH